MATTVADLYTQVLGRAPDAGGLAYWESMFGSSVDPTELATFKSVAQVTEPERVTPPAGAPVVDNTPAVPTTFDPFKSNISPSALQALQRLDLAVPRTETYTTGVGEGEMTLQRPVSYLPSGYGEIAGDGQVSGFFGPSEVINGVTVRPYYDAQGNLEKYVGGATQNLSDSVRLSAEWDPTGKAAPVQWNTDNGLFNSGVTFDDAVRTAIIAATAYNALGPTPTGAEAATAGTPTTTSGSTILDFSAPTSQGGLGLKGAAALDGTLASGLAAPAGGSLGGGLGLTAGAAGNIAAMGGAQGLLANAAGGGTLSAGGVNTGLFTADNLAKTLAGGGAAASTLTDTLKNLTPTQVTQLAKAGISVAGLLGGAAAAGGLVGGGSGGSLSLNPQDRSGVSSGSAQYSPEYYQAIQAKYNQMMPAQPRDVTTELKNWYETKYAPKVA